MRSGLGPVEPPEARLKGANARRVERGPPQLVRRNWRLQGRHGESCAYVGPEIDPAARAILNALAGHIDWTQKPRSRRVAS
jgi:hypothetical protein